MCGTKKKLGKRVRTSGAGPLSPRIPVARKPQTQTGRFKSRSTPSRNGLPGPTRKPPDHPCRESNLCAGNGSSWSCKLQRPKTRRRASARKQPTPWWKLRARNRKRSRCKRSRQDRRRSRQCLAWLPNRRIHNPPPRKSSCGSNATCRSCPKTGFHCSSCAACCWALGDTPLPVDTASPQRRWESRAEYHPSSRAHGKVGQKTLVSTALCLTTRSQGLVLRDLSQVGFVFVFSSALRQWRCGNTALIATLPVLGCLNLVHHLQHRCQEDRFLPQQTKKKKGAANAQPVLLACGGKHSLVTHLTSLGTRDPSKDDSSELSSQAPHLRKNLPRTTAAQPPGK